MSADLNAIKARWAATQAVRRKYPLRTGFGLGMTYGAVFLENAIANHAPGETNDPELREIWEADAEAIAHAPEDIGALIQALEEAVTRIDEIEKWATDHFGDSTEFPTDLAFAFWGMPSAADLEVDEDECIDDTDLCEHGLRFGCEACAEESP